MTHPPPVVQPPTLACSVQANPVLDLSQVDAAYDASPPSVLDDPCVAPPSVCADSDWLAYFDGGQCKGTSCELVTQYHFCTYGCSNGGCDDPLPTAPRGQFGP